MALNLSSIKEEKRIWFLFNYFLHRSDSKWLIAVECVPWCNNYYENTASRGVSYHQIPKDPKLKKLWKDPLIRVNLPADESTQVCSSHFTSADYDSGYQLREKPQRKSSSDD